MCKNKIKHTWKQLTVLAKNFTSRKYLNFKSKTKQTQMENCLPQSTMATLGKERDRGGGKPINKLPSTNSLEPKRLSFYL